MEKTKGLRYTQEYPVDKTTLRGEIARLIRENSVNEILLYSANIRLFAEEFRVLESSPTEILLREKGETQIHTVLDVFSFTSAFISNSNGTLVIL